MTEEAFLSALHENPSDTVTWLALVDWLEEHGQPQRAELIRIVRRLSAVSAVAPTPERRTLEASMTAMLTAGVRPIVAELTNSIGMRFAIIPPGTFLMGSPAEENGRYPDEQPHEVEITKPFYLGVHLVTQEQYRKVTRKTPSEFRAGGERGEAVEGMDTQQFPVENVSWDDALAFCKRLSNRAAEKKRGWTYRLPTEAEWELACRGLTTTAFHFGDTLVPGQIRCDEIRPCPVGSFPPNVYGLYDMHGNVYEWCHDFFDAAYYERSERQDPKGPDESIDHVLRGGSWDSPGEYCRSAWRDYNESDARLYINGFRVVLVRGDVSEPRTK